jgi:hypothetical protein
MASNSAPGGPTPVPYPNTVDLSSTSAPPRVASPLPKELLPADFQSILVRLAQKYGAGLHANVTDAEWVEISVENVSAPELHAQLQQERNVLFGAAQSRLQVIQPLQATGTGIYLHLLSEPKWGDLATVATRGKK